MPAELLLLLIVAFASPSCQVLSSLRMGEALQPCPCSSETLPSDPGLLFGNPGRPLPQDPGIRASALSFLSIEERQSPATSSLDPVLFSLRSRSPDPSSHPRSHPRISESGPQPLCPLSCNPG